MNTMHRLAARLLQFSCTSALALTCFISDASAVQLSADGLGEVLIFPYYNTRADNDTLISISNHSAGVKALKIRVVEGELGRVIFTTNLYLPPFQRWNASFSETETGPQLRSDSQACTLPTFNSPVELNLDALSASPDDRRNSLDRAREGYIEVIEMGVVAEEFFFAGANADAIIRPTNDPADPCALYAPAWFAADGIWKQNPQALLRAPSGQLSGDAVLINVPEARAAAYSATALKGFYQATTEADPVSLHSAPDDLALPNLASAAPAVSRVYLSAENPPRVIEDRWPDAISAVNASLMTAFIESAYVRDGDTQSESEHVFTLPTLYLSARPERGESAPFARTADPLYQACEGALGSHFDRNGISSPVILTTPPIPNFRLCHALNTMPVEINPSASDTPQALELSGRASPVLGSRLFLPLLPTDQVSNGWTSLDLAGVFSEHHLDNALSGRRYIGLPLVGFTATRTQNLALGALFGTAFRLQHHVRIE